MSRVSYEQARADHEYLWAIAPADDMTGRYVDQNDLRELLHNPTRSTARDCYVRQIEYWFFQGPETGMGHASVSEIMATDQKVAEIARRHRLSDE
ncbi:hypothetical protein [Magnetospirillum sulfuroxidans]|uniref:Uncharacterized protein n=1 Tax=Magnetospirillum sulfuroxidans TaxID=611300 RepID=A0ABS5I8R6_9PROT|nr:hypothetical protein [Magnetospirillum sulfuroxidans]MBR9970841.1 hypothetical protein [Magnetospirillum sulfuroxidans]